MTPEKYTELAENFIKSMGEKGLLITQPDILQNILEETIAEHLPPAYYAEITGATGEDHNPNRFARIQIKQMDGTKQWFVPEPQ